MAALGVVGTTVVDGPNKVFVGGLPYDLTEEQVKELMMAFGPLKAFHLVKEPGSSNSKGYGFCEYANPAHTKLACEGLNNMQLRDKTLTVRAATNTTVGGMSLPGLSSVASLQAYGALSSPPASYSRNGHTTAAALPTKVTFTAVYTVYEQISILMWMNTIATCPSYAKDAHTHTHIYMLTLVLSSVVRWSFSMK